LRKARTLPSLPRTATIGIPAASRAAYEPTSGKAADGQNGVGVQRSTVSISALSRSGER